MMSHVTITASDTPPEGQEVDKATAHLQKAVDEGATRVLVLVVNAQDEAKVKTFGGFQPYQLAAVAFKLLETVEPYSKEADEMASEGETP